MWGTALLTLMILIPSCEASADSANASHVGASRCWYGVCVDVCQTKPSNYARLHTKNHQQTIHSSPPCLHCTWHQIHQGA